MSAGPLGSQQLRPPIGAFSVQQASRAG